MEFGEAVTLIIDLNKKGDLPRQRVYVRKSKANMVRAE